MTCAAVKPNPSPALLHAFYFFTRTECSRKSYFNVGQIHFSNTLYLVGLGLLVCVNSENKGSFVAKLHSKILF